MPAWAYDCVWLLCSVPVNTRWLMLLMLVVTLTGNFGLAPMDLLDFDPAKVLKFQVGPATGQRSACNAWRCNTLRDLTSGVLRRVALCTDLADGYQLFFPRPARLRVPNAHDDPVSSLTPVVCAGGSLAPAAAPTQQRPAS